jgi:hypothetical protein
LAGVELDDPSFIDWSDYRGSILGHFDLAVAVTTPDIGAVVTISVSIALSAAVCDVEVIATFATALPIVYTPRIEPCRRS